MEKGIDGRGGEDGGEFPPLGPENPIPYRQNFFTADLPKPIFGAEAAKMTSNLKNFPFYPPHSPLPPPKVFFGLPPVAPTHGHLWRKGSLKGPRGKGG